MNRRISSSGKADARSAGVGTAASVVAPVDSSSKIDPCVSNAPLKRQPGQSPRGALGVSINPHFGQHAVSVMIFCSRSGFALCRIPDCSFTRSTNRYGKHDKRWRGNPGRIPDLWPPRYVTTNRTSSNGFRRQFHRQSQPSERSRRSAVAGNDGGSDARRF